MYINKRQGHDELFNNIAHHEFEQALDRTIGPEWRRLRPEPDIQLADDIPQDIDSWTPGFPGRGAEHMWRVVSSSALGGPVRRER